MLRSSIITFVIRIASLGVNFISTVLLARFLGVTAYGSIAFALSVIAVFSVPSTLGMGTLAVRMLPVNSDKKNIDQSVGFIWVSHTITVSASIVLFLVLYLSGLTNKIATGLFENVALFLACLSASLLLLHGGISRGFGKIGISQIQELIIRPILLVLIVSLIYFMFNFEVDISVPILLGLSGIVGVLLSTFMMKSYCSISIGHGEINPVSFYLRKSIPMMVTATFIMLNRQVDVITIGILLGKDEAGIYHVAARSAELVAIVLAVFNVVIGPKIAQLFAEKNLRDIEKIAVSTSGIATMLSLIPASILIFYGEFFLNIIYGPEFSAGAWSLAILSSAIVISAAFGSVGVILNMTGHENGAAFITAIVGVINILSNYILVLMYGAVGAAVATGFSLIIWHLSLSLYIKKFLNIRTSFLL